MDLKILLRHCGLTVVGNKPDWIERMLSSRRMIDDERCRLTLMDQASRGTKVPVEFLVDVLMTDQWNALPSWQAMT